MKHSVRVALIFATIAFFAQGGTAYAVTAAHPATPKPPGIAEIKKLCVVGKTDLKLQGWGFLSGYLLCTASDYYTGGATLFRQNVDGSFTRLAKGGGDISATQMEHKFGIPASTANALHAAAQGPLH